MMGETIAHGTPFYRALEEELVDPKFMVQIGLRGSTYGVDNVKEEFGWAQEKVKNYAWPLLCSP
jgi:guanidinobutyrase